MNIRSSCWATASTFVILLLLAVAVRAQLPSNGEVTGTVVDASGAAIAGANVSLIDRATSTAHGTKTDAAGEFSFRTVVPRTYDLTAQAHGFQTTVARALIVLFAKTTVQHLTRAVTGRRDV